MHEQLREAEEDVAATLALSDLTRQLISASSLPALLQLVAANGPAALSAEAVRCYLRPDLGQRRAHGSRVQDDVMLETSPGLVEKDSFGMQLWSLFSCVGEDLMLKEESSKADAGDAKMASFDHVSEASSPPSSPALLRETTNCRWEPQPVKTMSIKVAAPILFPPTSGFRNRQRQGGGGWSSWNERGGRGRGACGGAQIPNPPESSSTGAYKGR